MTGLALAIVVFALMLLAIFLRMPIGLAMLTAGTLGTWYVSGTLIPVLATLKSTTYGTFSSYSLSVVPLFLLMGQFATKGGMSKALFKAASAFLGHRRGGIAIATIGACGGFGAICGSSLATAATMANVALPEMRKHNYSGELAAGCLAAGGTLGILIPPSVILVIYAVLTEQNILKMFTAAIIPGILAAAGYMLTIAIYVRIKPESAPMMERVERAERWQAIARVWPVAAIFFIVIGGIYFGFFTPTEGAAVGALGVGILAWKAGNLDWATLKDCLLSTAVSSAMIFFIILGAALFNTFLAFTQTPMLAADWVASLQVSPWLVLAVMLASYLLMGCIMDSVSMILLTVPVFFPIITGLDFGMSPEETAIWFGILVLIVVETGLITPPVGLNIFIIRAIATDISLQQCYRGVIPFIASDAIRVILLVALPVLTLGLNRLIF